MGLVCILLLAVLATTSVDSYRGPYRGPYNRGSYNRGSYNSYSGSSRRPYSGSYAGREHYNRGYGDSYPSRGYKGYNRSPNNKGLSVLPKCSSGSTKLEIGVVGPDGMCKPGVCVHVTDSSSSTEHTTNRNGLIAVTVRGCSAQVSVSNQEFEADVQEVNLESCEDGKEKVVLSLTKKCNFYLHFLGVDTTESQLVHYSYTSKSGATGFGTTIGGCETAPTCIYVDTSNPTMTNLKIRISKSSGGNTINELEVNMLDNDDPAANMGLYGARMTIPSHFDIPNNNVLFYVYLNVWYMSEFDTCTEIIAVESLKLFVIDGMTVADVNDDVGDVSQTSPEELGFAVNKIVANSKDILVCIDLDTDNAADNRMLEGGAAFIDSNGKTTTNEIFLGTVEDNVEESYLPFCVCGGDSKKVVKVDAMKTLANGCVAAIANACEFAKVCNCPDSTEAVHCA